MRKEERMKKCPFCGKELSLPRVTEESEIVCPCGARARLKKKKNGRVKGLAEGFRPPSWKPWYLR